MRRFLSLAFMALLVPACALAQNAPVPKPRAVPADATAAKAKPKSAFGAVIAELTRAAQEQAAAKAKPTASPTSAAPALPPPPHASANATLADSSGG